MNQKQFVAALSEKFNLTPAQTERILKITLEQFSEVLLKKERIFFQSFGSFNPVLRPPKRFRNINTGKIETLPAHYDINFNPSKSFSKKLNKIPVPVVSKVEPKKSAEALAKAGKPKRKITLRKLIKLFTP